jgi:ribonuclease HI
VDGQLEEARLEDRGERTGEERRPVEELDEQVNRHNVTWKWVRGHIGHHGNERADQLANRGVDEVRGKQA